jgi:hypothetical protein
MAITIEQILKHHADAGKFLFISVNCLGLSPYNPNISKKFKHIPMVYSLILIIFFLFNIPLTFFSFQTDYLNVSLVTLTLQKVVECAVPITLIVNSLKEKGQQLKENVMEVVTGDQLLLKICKKPDFSWIKRFVKNSFIMVSVCAVSYVNIYFILLFRRHKFSISILELAFSTSSAAHVVYSIYFNWYYCSTILLFCYRFEIINDTMTSLLTKSIKNTYIRVRPYNVSSKTKINLVKRVHAINRSVMISFNGRYGFVLLLHFLHNVVSLITSLSFLMSDILSHKRVLEPIYLLVLVFNALSVSATLTTCAITTTKVF